MSQEYLIFAVSIIDTTEEQVSKLKEALEGTGITVQLRQEKQTPDVSRLVFNYDTENVKQIKSRGAGRKKVQPASFVTCAQVAEMRKTMSETEILEKLGMSRSTYYRRLKRLNGHFSELQHF